MKESLEGRVAVVTGAGRGIGQAYSRRLAEDGADVVMADVASSKETLGLVEAAGRRGLALECDVTSEESVQEMSRVALETFDHVDIVVNNVGTYPISPFADLTYAEWRRVFSVNLDSMFLVTREFLPGMRDRGWGRVVCMSSTVFHRGTPGFAHYVTTKGGAIGFMRALASEVGEEGVTVNAIAPSFVRTPGSVQIGEEFGIFEQQVAEQTIKRTQVPDDLVGALSFLVSNDASFMTGQTVVVDGGWVRT